MPTRLLHLFLVCGLSTLFLDWCQAVAAQDSSGVNRSDGEQSITKVPTGVILVKGSWSSASDTTTPLPEDGTVKGNTFTNKYFGISWTLPEDWTEQYKGPPPSDSGRYVLAEIVPADTFKGPALGSILITAEDMFFTPLPAANAVELINYIKDNLQADYKIEQPPTQIMIGGRSFSFFSYGFPVAELHWYVLATEIRCHTVEVVISSRDTRLIESLMRELNKMTLPAIDTLTGEDAVPVCIKDYASSENIIERVNPVFTEHRFNAVPVRIVIGKDGKIKHIHFLRAFPDQAKTVTDALEQWKVRSCLRDGKPVEVETGIMFGYAPRLAKSAAKDTVSK